MFEEAGITLITSMWPDMPSHIDAVYEVVDMGKMLFFKGSQLSIIS